MDNKWLWAGVAVVAGLFVGGVLARIVRTVLSNPKRPEALQSAAGPIASLAFSAALIASLITALGIVDPESLDTLPESLVDYIPRALSAAIVVIIANVAAGFASTVVDRSLGHVSPAMRRRVPVVIKAAIMGAAVLIAASQLGVDTTILTLAAAAIFFSIGLSAALMVGFGSRFVSAEIAASRALQRTLSIGDRVVGELVAGTIVEFHPALVELRDAAGQTMTVPNSKLLDQVLAVTRPAAGGDAETPR